MSEETVASCNGTHCSQAKTSAGVLKREPIGNHQKSVDFYRKALVGIGIDCRNEGAEASKDLLLLGTCRRGMSHVLNYRSLSCVSCFVFCCVSYAGWEPG